MSSLVDAPVAATPEVAPTPATNEHTGRTWRRLWWALAAAIVIVAVVVYVQSAVYQPLEFGGSEGTGVTHGSVGQIHMVNDVDGQIGQYLVPATARSFYISFSLYNPGSHAVTILGASIHPPLGPAPAWPLANAGAVYYVAVSPSPVLRPLTGVSVAPKKGVLINLNVRTVDRCYEANGWTGFSTVYVTERYLTFSHVVAVALPTPFVMHEPEPSGPGVVCPTA